ncbi:hypothetical protein [Nocardia sp. NPDC004260]
MPIPERRATARVVFGHGLLFAGWMFQPANRGAARALPPPARSERIAASIPGARLHTIADCGHTSSWEQPVAITALLREFLATVDGS